MATSEITNRALPVAKPGAGSAPSSDPDHLRGKQGSILFWMLADVLSVLVALVVSFKIAFNSGPIDGIRTVHAAASHLNTFGGPSVLLLAYLGWFLLTLLLVSRRYHLYGPLRITSMLHEQRRSLQSCFTAGLLLTGGLYLIHGEVISRTLVLLMIVCTTLLLSVRRLVWRAIIYRRYERGHETRQILIVGTGRVAQALRHHIESIRHLGYTFMGFVHVPGVDMDLAAMGGDILGNVDEVFDLARKHFVDEIFVASPCERGLVKHIVEQSRKAGVDIRVVPDLYDGLAWNSTVEYIGQFPTIPLHRGEVPEIGLFLKRALDVVLSSIALIALAPIMLVIAIAIKLDTHGPIIYASERIGKKGRVFRCMKFRTMVRDAERRRADVLHMNERDGVLFKITNDPRITRVGAFLRKYSFDELPQFFNVLRGDMSMVGPRPPLASEVKQYELSHLRRLDVMPGITGLWQVQARQDPSFDSYISMDTAYIENWSIWLDLKILLRTFAVVVGGTGA